MKRLRRWILLACFVAGIALGFVVMRLDARVRTYLAGPPLGGARIYAEPSVLRVGDPVPGGSLARTLARLGYREVPAGDPAVAAGEFRAVSSTVELAQRLSPVPWAEGPRHARVTVRAGRITELRDVESGPLEHLELEPEMLAVIGGAGPALGAD